MENYTVEIKVKVVGMPWELIKGIKLDTGEESMDSAKKVADDIAKKISKAEKAEVRWEFVGIGQGHYIRQ